MESDYKPLFELTLKPFFEFLTYQKQEGSIGIWMDRVEKVRLCIIANPEQYLGKELPETALIKSIVTEIFDDYLRRSLDTQGYRHIGALYGSDVESGVADL